MEKFPSYIAFISLLITCFINNDKEVSCSSSCSPAQQILNAKCNLTVMGTTLASVSLDQRVDIVKQVRSSSVCDAKTIDCLQDNFFMTQARNPAKDLIYALWTPFDSLCLNGYHTCSGGTLKTTDLSVIILTAAKDKKKFRADYIQMFGKAPERSLGNVQDAAACHYVQFITTNGPTTIDCSNPAAIAKQLEADAPNMGKPEGRKNIENLFFSLNYDCIHKVNDAYEKTHKNSSGILGDFKELPSDYSSVYDDIDTGLSLQNPATSGDLFAGSEHGSLIVNGYAEYSCLMRIFEPTLCYVANCAYNTNYQETLWKDVQYSRGDDAFKQTVKAYIDHSCGGGKPDCSKPPN